MLNQIRKSQVKDVSFANLFWKRFVIRLIVLLIVSMVVFFYGQHVVEVACERQIQGELARASLLLAQTEDVKSQYEKFDTDENVILSEAYEAINRNPFITDSSICIYDMTNQRLVSKSSEIPVVRSVEAIEWWREQTSNSGLPTLSLTEEALEFCSRYKNDCLYVDDVYCVNSVLLPSSIVVKNDDGKELDRYEEFMPSILENSKIYDGSMQFEIIGNRDEDRIHTVMLNFSFQQTKTSTDGTENENSNDENEAEINETGSVVISYDGYFDYGKASLITETFVINEVEYQVDCGYQVNFWSGAGSYVIVAEIIIVLLCALGAFINTKETFVLYN